MTVHKYDLTFAYLHLGSVICLQSVTSSPITPSQLNFTLTPVKLAVLRRCRHLSHLTTLVHPSPLSGMHSYQPSTPFLEQEVSFPITSLFLPLYVDLWTSLVMWFSACSIPRRTHLCVFHSPDQTISTWSRNWIFHLSNPSSQYSTDAHSKHTL